MDAQLRPLPATKRKGNKLSLHDIPPEVTIPTLSDHVKRGIVACLQECPNWTIRVTRSGRVYLKTGPGSYFTSFSLSNIKDWDNVYKRHRRTPFDWSMVEVVK